MPPSWICLATSALRSKAAMSAWLPASALAFWAASAMSAPSATTLAIEASCGRFGPVPDLVPERVTRGLVRDHRDGVALAFRGVAAAGVLRPALTAARSQRDGRCADRHRRLQGPPGLPHAR